MRITRIFLQPVKSLHGCNVDSVEIDELGMVGDRRFMLVDEAGKFMTQRTLPQMARVTAQVVENHLVLEAKSQSPLAVPLQSKPREAPRLRTVNIWKSEGLLAEDCGADAARWLTEAVGLPCGLVRVGPAFARPIPLHRVPEPLKAAAPRVAFSDAFPFMIIGEATLDDLNRRLEDEGLPKAEMERFRPSFAFSGGEPFAEDRWSRLQAGPLGLHPAGCCVRCLLPCVDPWTGERGHEPIRLLATYRRDPNDSTRLLFGQNAVHEYTGPARIQVGDPVSGIPLP
ncbi:MAG TPA: MOSC N-terminal beta barrel domain-containing protein [Opitutaceae bacterium]|jgi:hypothetical protein